MGVRCVTRRIIYARTSAVVLNAVQQYPSGTGARAWYGTCADRSLVLAAVSKDGRALRYASYDLRLPLRAGCGAAGSVFGGSKCA